MHATFVHVRDPFRHHVNRHAHRVTRRTRIDTLLRQQGLIVGRGRRMRRTSPFVVASGSNNFLLEKDWKRCVAAGELITVVALPKGGSALRTIALVVVAVVAAWVTGGAGGALVAGSFSATAAGAAVAIAGSMLVNAVLPLPKPPTGSTDTKSGAYGIGAKNNSARLLQSIPVMYGRFNVTPDYAALPYTEFQGNNQTLYSLLAISQGQIADPQIRIGETPIDNFEEVAYEIIPPGGTVTLFPDNVVTSDAVQGLELKRPGEGGDWMGPYVANPAGTVTQQLAVDVGFASGIYRINGDGKEKAAVASWEIQAQRIDDNGNPVGDWFKGVAQKVQKDDRTPGLFDTYTFQVPEGRYQVRGRAYDTEQGGGTVVNAVTWVGLRAYLPSKRTYGDLTLLAVRIKATNNINSSTAKAINVTATRMLPVWTGSAWTAPQATRSPAWALADILRNTTYGRGWADNRLNLPELVRLAGVWAARGDTFDGVFDTKTSLWDALSSVARVGRAVPMYYAGVVDIVRDEPRDEVPLVITPDKITAGSFSIDYAFPSQDTPDHVVVSYIDDQTWKAQTVVCALGNSPKLKPKNITLMGVTSRDQAFREGIYMAACNRDQRKFPTVTTEMEGYIPKFGDLVSLSHDVPAWGESGVVMDFDAATNTITTSEPTQWFVGQPHYLRLARRNGSQDGPYLVTKGGDDFSLVLQGLTDAQKAALWFGDGYSEDRTVYQFGPANKESQECLVIKSRPDGTGKVTLSLVNYAYSVYVAENDVNVPPPGSGSLLLDQPAAPSVGGVGVKQDADTQLVWLYVEPVPGAVTYEFQISYDGGLTWISVGIVRTNSVQVRIPGGTWIVRARAYGAGGIGGPWNQNPVNVPGLPPALGELTNLVATPMVMAILVTWQLPERLNLIGADSVEIYFGTSNNRSQASRLATVALPSNSYTLSNLKAGVQFYFWARVRGTDTGNYGPEIGPVPGASSSDAAQILDYLTGKITSTQLAKDLNDKIDSVAELQSFIQPPAAWTSGTAYHKDDLVSHDGRMYRAQVDVPASGPVPGTDGLIWQDIGSVEQTATGLALQMAETTLKVEELDGEVQATATKTESVYVQMNPTRVGADTDGKIGDDTSTETAGFFSQTLAQVDDNHALGKRLTTVQAQFNTQLAAVTTDVKTLSDGQQSIASQVTTVQSVAGNASNTAAAASASAQLALNTAANVNGKVSSSIVAKVGVTSDGKYFSAGWAIGIDGSGGTVQSQFLVTADTFAIVPSAAGGAARIPFLVQSGQVFLDVAFIADGTITDAKIGNLIRSTAVNSAGQPVWEINKNGTRYVRGNQFTITEDVNGWRMSNGSFNVIEIGVLS